MLNFLLIHVLSSGHFVYVWKICSIDSTFGSNFPLYNCKGIVSFIGSFLKNIYFKWLPVLTMSKYHLAFLISFPYFISSSLPHSRKEILIELQLPAPCKLVLKTLNPRMQWDKALAHQTIFTLCWKELSETEKVVLSTHWDWFSLLSQTCI